MNGVKIWGERFAKYRDVNFPASWTFACNVTFSHAVSRIYFLLRELYDTSWENIILTAIQILNL